jgi:hypothetical protein
MAFMRFALSTRIAAGAVQSDLASSVRFVLVDVILKIYFVHESALIAEAMFKSSVISTAVLLLAHAGAAFAQQAENRDAFYWLGEINKATAVINTEEGLLDKSLAPKVAAGIATVLDQGRQAGRKPARR